jgi:hypothetical protein
MTSAVALALMAKALAVFGGDGTFLSFPLTPISFTKKQLNFLTDAGDPAAALADASEFAFIVNQIPSGHVWPTVETSPLWQEYTRILKQAQLANEQRTAAEESQYKAAMATLYVEGADGLHTDAPLVLVYKQYRDAYLNARQQFASRKIAADMSADPAVKAQWAAEQPALQTTVSAALSAWQSQGQKSKVEDARRIESSLGAKSPSATWSQWSSIADPDVVAMTDLSSRRFYPTAFAPASAIDSPLWQQFSLDAAEIATLAAKAPPELASRLGGGTGGTIPVESVKFEFTSVTITRPWFVSDVFEARFWKLNSTPNVVSDGKIPPRGTIPGYTVAMVFARNIEVKLGKALANAPADETALALGPLHVNTLVESGGRRISLSALTPQRGGVRPIFVQNTAEQPHLQPQPQPQAPHGINLGSLIRPGLNVHIENAAQPQVQAQARAAPMMMRLSALNFGRVQPQPLIAVQPPAQPPPVEQLVQPPATDQPPAQTPPVPPPSPADEQIYVLGFICKPVPHSPNPDPALPW